ncbi:hypothetical protein CAK95_03475 [Pseudorhodoplanes sinuspersici]|uniref:Uncharacterized protein n=2 Tax=Pseudorhodoplanes sinuspersici TaxID=1235591 RepID=A0A1W6ZLV3_9HYPH|nr:hypothetical protein CAK95_03475 [Pseudorhodoplanes sinuspersici]
MRVVVHRKGELTRKAVDRDWPYQVALPHLDVIEIFSRSGDFLWRTSFACASSRRRCERWRFNLYCFSDEADAEKFRVRFNDLKFDPTWRGRGDAKNRWVGGNDYVRTCKIAD